LLNRHDLAIQSGLTLEALYQQATAFCQQNPRRSIAAFIS